MRRRWARWFGAEVYAEPRRARGRPAGCAGQPERAALTGEVYGRALGLHRFAVWAPRQLAGWRRGREGLVAWVATGARICAGGLGPYSGRAAGPHMGRSAGAPDDLATSAGGDGAARRGAPELEERSRGNAARALWVCPATSARLSVVARRAVVPRRNS